jgi:hypothetical protein
MCGTDGKCDGAGACRKIRWEPSRPSARARPTPQWTCSASHLCATERHDLQPVPVQRAPVTPPVPTMRSACRPTPAG